MRPYRALFLIVAAVFVMFANGVPLRAQDAIPETPPELRDFRLDPERAAPQPTPQPTVTPPPVVETVPDAAPETTAPVQQRPAARRPAVQPSAASAEPETTTPAESAPILPEAVPAEPVIERQTAPVASPDETDSNWNLGLIGGIVGAILIALTGLWLALKRRRTKHEEQIHYEPPVAEPEKPTPVMQPVVRPPAPVARPKPVETDDIALAFVPEKATISFTTLSVKGQLKIANEGRIPAKNLQFRAGLISASNQQQMAMQAFFSDSGIAANALGEAKPGEKLSMSIELTVPLTEMQSFPLGDQRLLVPIMVAELAYKADDGVDRQVRIASMLGREAKPPQPKMGPLRLDQGPRSFAPLGQRPLQA